jgi:hypothetical protein
VKISVLSYPEAGGPPRPHAFQLGGRRVAVVAILDQWDVPSHHYFQVRDFDGRRFVLRYSPQLKCWELEAVYGPTAGPVRAPRTAAA